MRCKARRIAPISLPISNNRTRALFRLNRNRALDERFHEIDHVGWVSHELYPSYSFASFDQNVGNDVLASCFDAFSLREPGSTSLENALGRETTTPRCDDRERVSARDRMLDRQPGEIRGLAFDGLVEQRG